MSHIDGFAGPVLVVSGNAVEVVRVALRELVARLEADPQAGVSPEVFEVAREVWAAATRASAGGSAEGQIGGSVPPSSPRDLLSTKEAARMASCTPRRIRQLALEGRLAGATKVDRPGGRQDWLIPAASIAARMAGRP